MSDSDSCYLLQEVSDLNGDVYYGGPVKIGYAKHPELRLSGNQTGNPRILAHIAVGPGGKRLETEFKKKWAAFLIRGEWFRYHPDMPIWLAAKGCKISKSITPKYYDASSKKPIHERRVA